MPIRSRIRTVPDYPKPGVMFRDITTLLKDPIGLSIAIDELTRHYADFGVDKVAGIEARGFIIAAPLAYTLGKGFVPIRKHGKLPAATVGQDYDLEYGTDRVEVHVDAIEPGDRVLVIDDLIATGGTAAATCLLIGTMGGVVAGCGFVIELPDLGGRARLEQQGHPVFALCAFEGD